MRNKRLKNNIVSEVIIFLMTLALILLITRIWAILFLVILGIFIAALRLLFLSTQTVEIIEPVTQPPPYMPETETEILRLAFSLIQKRITQEVKALYPAAQWHWLTPNAMVRIEKDEPVRIILSGAGGYQKASVSVHNLAFQGLVFEVALPESVDAIQQHDPEEDSTHDSDTPETICYEYLAFEWTDAHLLRLNARANEELGQGKTTLLIPECELPVKDSWQAICTQLIKNDFADATVRDDGILISLQQ